MDNKKLLKLAEQESDKAQKGKSNAIMNALLIGAMIGIIIWSVAKGTVGLFTLIPLFFVYKMLNK